MQCIQQQRVLHMTYGSKDFNSSYDKVIRRIELFAVVYIAQLKHQRVQFFIRPSYTPVITQKRELKRRDCNSFPCTLYRQDIRCMLLVYCIMHFEDDCGSFCAVPLSFVRRKHAFKVSALVRYKLSNSSTV